MAKFRRRIALLAITILIVLLFNRFSSNFGLNFELDVNIGSLILFAFIAETADIIYKRFRT